jgi:hypothetical protein
MDSEEITLDGHRVTCRRAGWGPVILLIHGISGERRWREFLRGG